MIRLENILNQKLKKLDMQYYRCECGKCEMWNTGEPIHDCMGCDECKTTFSQSPERHRELKPHDFSKILYNQNTGKPYKMCSKCHHLDEVSYKESQKKE